jgi:hypothetical protein
MTSEEDVAEAEVAFSEALGHIRNATEELLGADDLSTGSLLLGVAGLDLQAMFGEVWPTWIPHERTAAESLFEAERILGEVIDQVPLGLWAALGSLRERVGDGDR